MKFTKLLIFAFAMAAALVWVAPASAQANSIDVSIETETVPADGLHPICDASGFEIYFEGEISGDIPAGAVLNVDRFFNGNFEYFNTLTVSGNQFEYSEVLYNGFTEGTFTYRFVLFVPAIPAVPATATDPGSAAVAALLLTEEFVDLVLEYECPAPELAVDWSVDGDICADSEVTVTAAFEATDDLGLSWLYLSGPFNSVNYPLEGTSETDSFEFVVPQGARPGSYFFYVYVYNDIDSRAFDEFEYVLDAYDCEDVVPPVEPVAQVEPAPSNAPVAVVPGPAPISGADNFVAVDNDRYSSAKAAGIFGGEAVASAPASVGSAVAGSGGTGGGAQLALTGGTASTSLLVGLATIALGGLFVIAGRRRGQHV